MLRAMLLLMAATLLASCAGASAGNRMARCEYRDDPWGRSECARQRAEDQEQQDAEQRQRQRRERARENADRDAPRDAQLAQIGY